MCTICMFDFKKHANFDTHQSTYQKTYIYHITIYYKYFAKARKSTQSLHTQSHITQAGSGWTDVLKDSRTYQSNSE